MLAELRREFERRFGRPPECAARAPGRVNLIGEHTDYNEGLALPLAIDRDTVSLAATRPDGRFRVYSREQDEVREFEAGSFQPAGQWVDYVRGVVLAIGEAGRSIPGLDIAIASEVPLGSGLSSSAALCVSLVTLIDEIAALGLEPIHRARFAHRAESELVGVGCGILDQFATALGSPGSAVRIDCRSQQVESVPVPKDLCIVVANSGVARSLVNAGYRERVAECRAALVQVIEHGIVAADATGLSDLTIGSLTAVESHLPANLFRRARHVVTENVRVDAMCRALRGNDLEAAGKILKEGMHSLRFDFEVSTPRLDRLCEVADAIPGVFGSRLTGAGFGGCTIHLVAPSVLPALKQALGALTPTLHAIGPAAPASAMPLH